MTRPAESGVDGKQTAPLRECCAIGQRSAGPRIAIVRSQRGLTDSRTMLTAPFGEQIIGLVAEKG
jgi:hypothetical protein